ncbi:YqgE/AlgH family protein [Atopomonas sediminilitoris]|uniref:YqgE/AlgH family protein n=1 Tax=Atopomonas sediminilitoris TaxID=2919919 RepID=UPI001F4E7FD2|nr:YqgE/AlgH family protein [Atopomonas sediminilitoris]MCJ8168232.1 YqgE/AlgH family protein [Atopomonas sediminilitoris]
MNNTAYLRNHFLIAMPHMADPNFAHTLTYICEHSADGAMGIIINRLSGLDLGDILQQLEAAESIIATQTQQPIFAGGPVQTDRGFVLHSASHKYQSTLDLGQVCLSTSQDVLLDLAEGKGPAQSLIALGYAGWEAGQLEAELTDNAWLTCPATLPILFEVDPDARLAAAAHSLGIELSLLSSQAGHA